MKISKFICDHPKIINGTLLVMQIIIILMENHIWWLGLLTGFCACINLFFYLIQFEKFNKIIGNSEYWRGKNEGFSEGISQLLVDKADRISRKIIGKINL